MFPIIILTTFEHALTLMAHGWWAVRYRPGVFAATPAAPRPGPAIFQVSRAAMGYLIRHGDECTGAGNVFRCTSSQIGG